ncbi:MAG: PIN domain-containing protein [Myxococcales bacterium]|jgi:predicted nucleic acid-binding protein
MKLLLDTGILGRVCHPSKYQEVRDWLAVSVADHDLLISEVADYELRRELIRIGATRSLARLDELERELRYVPVTTATWRSAAKLWAWARRTGKATASGDALDGDVLIAAQARAEDAVVVTTNPRHFEQFVEARRWGDAASK